MTLFFVHPISTLESRNNPVHWSPWSQVPSHEPWIIQNKKYDKEGTLDWMTCIRLWLPYLAFNQPGKLWSLSMSPLPFVFCLKHKLSLYSCKLFCHRYRVVIIAAHCFVNAHGKPSQSGPKKMTYCFNLKCNLKSENCLKTLMKYDFVILRSGNGQLWITNQKWVGFKMDVMENCRTHQISQNMGWSIKK